LADEPPVICRLVEPRAPARLEPCDTVEPPTMPRDRLTFGAGVGFGFETDGVVCTSETSVVVLAAGVDGATRDGVVATWVAAVFGAEATTVAAGPPRVTSATGTLDTCGAAIACGPFVSEPSPLSDC
jgi:hypothetical protein